jgi:glyoxylase-like metal-dependent hydrolase (beta-lactamase superfamily II)
MVCHSPVMKSGAHSTMALRPNSHFKVTSDVDGFRSVMVNYYFVRTGSSSRDWVLVDAGLRGSAARLKHEAEKRFGSNRPPLAVILTHGHFDHVGALPALLQEWDVPVYAHVDELPYINEHEPYPSPDPTVGGGLMALSSPLYPRHVAQFRATVRALGSDGRVPSLPEWTWIPTPGHSPGHVSLWRERDRLLISGDALITTRQESALAVFRQTLEVRPPPAYFTPDWLHAYYSLQRLRALAPSRVASGHGLPADGDFLRRGLDRLVSEFPSCGLPRHGRYVPTAWSPRWGRQ